MRTHARLSRFVLAVPALLSLSASPALGQVAQPQVTVLRLFPGDWLGPFPSNGVDCYDEYLEWFIYGTGSYTSTWNSYPQGGTNGCGGSTAYGRWSVRGDVVTFHQQSVPGCAECTQRETIPLYYRFITVNALRFCDYPNAADGCWVYYRQRA
jgi:hypothetical protein